MPVTWHSLYHTVDGLVAVGTILLALGTLLVAIVTLLTALSTRRLARETTSLVDATIELARVSAEEVELSRRAMQASVKPLIVDWPADNRKVIFRRFADGARITVPACNAGMPALIQRVTMHWDEPRAPVTPTTYQGTATVLALMSGGDTEARFDFGAAELPRIDLIEQQGKFWVEFTYTDATGDQAEITRLDVYKASTDVAGDEWRVWAVSFRRADETEPYAQSRPANR